MSVGEGGRGPRGKEKSRDGIDKGYEYVPLTPSLSLLIFLLPFAPYSCNSSSYPSPPFVPSLFLLLLLLPPSPLSSLFPPLLSPPCPLFFSSSPSTTLCLPYRPVLHIDARHKRGGTEGSHVAGRKWRLLFTRGGEKRGKEGNRDVERGLVWSIPSSGSR